jgi:anti-sigma factor RsiW
MADEIEDRRQEDERLRRLLIERLPRHAPPAHLRAAIVNAVERETPKRRWGWLWLSPAAAAAAMALIMVMWVAPSLQTTASSDPIRLLARALVSEHARTIFYGEPRADVVPAVLPRAMEESGVAPQLGVHR